MNLAAEADKKPWQPPQRRFSPALLGGQADRVPVGNAVSVVTTELMRQAGACFPQAHGEPRPMAALAATGHTVWKWRGSLRPGHRPMPSSHERP